MDASPFLYFLSEFLGTFILILVGLGVNSNVSLKKTKGSNSGWIIICWGWAMAVFLGATIALYSGGQINPAVTLALFATQSIGVAEFFLAVVGQLLGAFVGALLVIYLFWNHFKITENADAIGGSFFTGPAINSPLRNFTNEMFGTFLLVAGILFTFVYASGFYVPLLAGLVVFGVGLTLGGLTGFAINPARDLMPRLAHYLMPVPNKGSSNWSYAWVPIFGPLVGALLVVALSYSVLAFPAIDTNWKDIWAVDTTWKDIAIGSDSWPIFSEKVIGWWGNLSKII